MSRAAIVVLVLVLVGCGPIAFEPLSNDANDTDANDVEVCAITPCCAAVAGGRCYYIDAQLGNDANPATFEQPWRSYLPLTGAVRLAAGDVVYFMSGTYSDTWLDGAITRALHFSDATNYALAGTVAAPIVLRAYPGHAPVLSTPTAIPVSLESPSHVQVRGIAIERADRNAIFVRGADDVLFEDVRVSGVGSINNFAYEALSLSMSTGVTLRRFEAVDVYNPAVTGYGIFSSFSSFELVDSRITLAQETPGLCINGVTASGSRVTNNVFTNCKGGVRLEGDGIQVTGNQFTRSALDLILTPRNVAVTFNTLIDTSFRFMVLNGDALANRFESNIVLDTLTATFDASTAVIAVMPSGDATWRAPFDAGTALASTRNCIFASASPLRLSYFGALDTVAQWQARGFDTSSQFIDPQLDSTGAPTAPACTGYGHTNAP